MRIMMFAVFLALLPVVAGAQGYTGYSGTAPQQESMMQAGIAQNVPVPPNAPQNTMAPMTQSIQQPGQQEVPPLLNQIAPAPAAALPAPAAAAPVAAAPVAPAVPDACAGYMADYNAYIVCKDRLMKIQRMQQPAVQAATPAQTPAAAPATTTTTTQKAATPLELNGVMDTATGKAAPVIQSNPNGFVINRIPKPAQ